MMLEEKGKKVLVPDRVMRIDGRLSRHYRVAALVYHYAVKYLTSRSKS